MERSESSTYAQDVIDTSKSQDILTARALLNAYNDYLQDWGIIDEHWRTHTDTVNDFLRERKDLVRSLVRNT
jgi:hypothetical protein